MEKDMETKTFHSRKGMNILTKMLLLLLLPMLVFLIFANRSIHSVVKVTSARLVEYELMGMTYVMGLDLSNISSEKMQYRDGSLYKGEINLSESSNFIKEFAENTGVDITVFWNSESVSTSIKDASGAPVGSFQLDKK